MQDHSLSDDSPSAMAKATPLREADSVPAMELPTTQAERAGIGARVSGVFLSLFACALGLVGLFGMPEGCRVIGYVAAAMFIPASALVLFTSLRGRKADLQPLTLRESADVAGTTVVENVVSEVIDKLM